MICEAILNHIWLPFLVSDSEDHTFSGLRSFFIARTGMGELIDSDSGIAWFHQYLIWFGLVSTV